MPSYQCRRIFVEGPSGQRFEADVPCEVPLSGLAAQFAQSQGWPLQDHRGRGQRAVVELVNPNNPDETKRLNGELDLVRAGIRDGDTLRVFPESIAATVNQSDRLIALISDHNDLLALESREPRIRCKGNRSHAPDRYEITFHYDSFIELLHGQGEPRRGSHHQVEIVLGADYPRAAPLVRWLTPIFHPNIRPDQEFVCIGELKDRWRPGLGLARLVLMLAEMIQYHNFNPIDGCHEAACRWAADPANRHAIESIGGHPFQGPMEQVPSRLGHDEQTAIEFRPL